MRRRAKMDVFPLMHRPPVPIVRHHVEGSASYHFFEEDWPGEAALIESEMKRFREWAKKELGRLGPYPGMALFVEKGGFFSCYAKNPCGHLRLVYSPEEGA